MNLEIKATGAVSGAAEAYIAWVWREWRTAPCPGVHSEEAIYEITLDASNHYRRIADAQPNQPPAVLNPQGTKAAFEMFVDGKFVVSIYALPEWKLLHTWDLTKLTQGHCRLCTPLSYGWFADGNRLFFELGLVGKNEDEESKNGNVPGTYIISGTGRTWVASLQKSALFNWPDIFTRNSLRSAISSANCQTEATSSKTTQFTKEGRSRSFSLFSSSPSLIQNLRNGFL